MRKPRRLFVFCLVVTFLLMFNVSSFAKQHPSNINSSEEVLFQNQEIKNHSTLLTRAKSGISDINNEKIKPDAKIMNVETNMEKDVKTNTTTQLLKSVKTEDGNIRNEYVTTTFATVETPDLVTTSSLRNKYDWDNEAFFGSVRAYSTIYWNIVEGDDSIDYYSLSHAIGGWTRLDYQATVTDKIVWLGQTGWARNAGVLGYIQQYTSASSVAYTFTKYAPSSWTPVSANADHLVGCTQRATINQQGSSWNFEFSHRIDGTTSDTW